MEEVKERRIRTKTWKKRIKRHGIAGKEGERRWRKTE